MSDYNQRKASAGNDRSVLQSAALVHSAPDLLMCLVEPLEGHGRDSDAAQYISSIVELSRPPATERLKRSRLSRRASHVWQFRA